MQTIIPTIEDTAAACEALDNALRKITTPAELAALVPLANIVMAHPQGIDFYYDFPSADRRYVVSYRPDRLSFETEALGGREIVETPLGNRPRWTRTDWRHTQELKSRTGLKNVFSALETIAPLQFVGRDKKYFQPFSAYRTEGGWNVT